MSIEHKSISGQPEKQGKKLFRKTVTAVRIGLAALTLSSIVACNFKPSTTSEPTPTPVSSTADTDMYYRSMYGITIGFAKDQLPLMIPEEFTLSNGKRILFDKGELLQLREKAISEKEPEVVTVIPLTKANYGPYEYSVEHPKTSELPEDVLSEENLQAKGVSIMQADNTTLYIRKSAFEKDGILADFNNTGRKLSIVLVNQPFLTDQLLQDPRYENIRTNFPEIEIPNLNEYRAERVAAFEKDLGRVRQTRGKMPVASPSEDEVYRQLVALLKFNIFIYGNLLTPEQLIEDVYLENKETKAGRYFWRNNDLTAVTVAVAVGKRVDRSYIGFYFKEDGWFAFLNSEDLDGLRPDQTYPDPADFTINPLASVDNPNLNLYGTKSRGFTLRHEIGGHDVSIGQALTNGGTPNYSEYDADMTAMDGIRKAWDKWVESRYKDNSGYPFVFRLSDGTYILNRKKKKALQ